jgi:hypothetical protein
MGNASSALVGLIGIALGGLIILVGAITKQNSLQTFGLVVLLCGLYLFARGGETYQQPQPTPQDAEFTRPDDDEKEKCLERYRDVSLVFAGAIIAIVITSLLDNTEPIPWIAGPHVFPQRYRTCVGSSCTFTCPGQALQ